jgi:RNA polymerase sigma-70 factor (ECF subfamily)
LTDWEAIIRANGPTVWRTLFRVTGSRADADDCFQEVFMEALRLSRRRKIDHWPAWLHRLAVCRAIDQLRRRRRSPLSDELLGDIPSREPDAAQSAQAKDSARQLRAALAALPPRQAQAITLHLLSDWSYEQIAAELQTSVSNVGVLIHRAKAQLRERLEPHHEPTA